MHEVAYICCVFFLLCEHSVFISAKSAKMMLEFSQSSITPSLPYHRRPNRWRQRLEIPDSLLSKGSISTVFTFNLDGYDLINKKNSISKKLIFSQRSIKKSVQNKNVQDLQSMFNYALGTWLGLLLH